MACRNMVWYGLAQITQYGTVWYRVWKRRENPARRNHPKVCPNGKQDKGGSGVKRCGSSIREEWEGQTTSSFKMFPGRTNTKDKERSTKIKDVHSKMCTIAFRETLKVKTTVGIIVKATTNLQEKFKKFYKGKYTLRKRKSDSMKQLANLKIGYVMLFQHNIIII